MDDDRLLADWLDRGVGADLLARRLRADPQLRARLRGQLAMQQFLHDALPAAPSAPAAGWWPGLALAALLLVGLTLGGWWMLRPLPAPAAVVVAGDAGRERGAGARVAVGERLLAGTIGVELRAADGSLLAVAPGGALTLLGHDTGWSWQLHAGAVRCTVAAQPPGRRWRIAGRHAIAEVLGTEFTIAESPEATAIDVASGLVAVQGADGARRELAAGERLTLGPVPQPPAVPDWLPPALGWPVAAWNFAGAAGEVPDAIGIARDLTLRPDPEAQVRWLADGMAVAGPARLRSADSVRPLIDRIVAAQAFTIWLDLAIEPSAPGATAQILGLGRNRRWFALSGGGPGMDTDRMEIRLRCADPDGVEAVRTWSTPRGSLGTGRHRLAVALAASGALLVAIDGALQPLTPGPGGPADGPLVLAWPGQIPLELAGSVDADVLRGTYHALAIADRAVDAATAVVVTQPLP